MPGECTVANQRKGGCCSDLSTRSCSEELQLLAVHRADLTQPDYRNAEAGEKAREMGDGWLSFSH